MHDFHHMQCHLLNSLLSEEKRLQLSEGSYDTTHEQRGSENDSNGVENGEAYGTIQLPLLPLIEYEELLALH